MLNIDDELASARWKDTYRGNQHQYILESDYPGLVRKVESLIKTEGKRMSYKKSYYRYWIHKGWKYWIMKGLYFLPRTRVLNRARI